MKLTPTQSFWLNNYERARIAGGSHDSDLGWVPFEEIPVPEWYEVWLESKEVVDEAPSAVLPLTQPITGRYAEFREFGRLGGLKTREKGREYYSAIGRMGGRGHRK
jgi:hypothetical protein